MKKIVLLALAALVAFTAPAADKKIVLVAGSRSHGHGDHEFRTYIKYNNDGFLFHDCI